MPKIFMSSSVQKKLKAITELCTKEISAWISVTKKEDKYYLDDCYLPEQEVSDAAVRIESSQIARMIGALGPEKCSAFRAHYHSHVNMGVTPSGVDVDDLRSSSKNVPYFITIIGNKKGEMSTRFRDTTKGITYHNLAITIETEIDPIVEQMKIEIKEKVNQKVHNVSYGTPDYDDEEYWINSWNTVGKQNNKHLKNSNKVKGLRVTSDILDRCTTCGVTLTQSEIKDYGIFCALCAGRKIRNV